MEYFCRFPTFHCKVQLNYSIIIKNVPHSSSLCGFALMPIAWRNEFGHILAKITEFGKGYRWHAHGFQTLWNRCELRPFLAQSTSIGIIHFMKGNMNAMHSDKTMLRFLCVENAYWIFLSSNMSHTRIPAVSCYSTTIFLLLSKIENISRMSVCELQFEEWALAAAV